MILRQIKSLFKYYKISLVFMFNCQCRRPIFYCGRFRWRSQTRRRRWRSRCWRAQLQILVRRERCPFSPSWNVLLRRDPGWGQMRVAVVVVFVRDIVAFVSVFFAGSGKEAHVCLNVLLAVKIWFQRFDRLSVSILVYRNSAQGVMFKLNGLFIWLPLKSSLSTDPIRASTWVDR